MQAVRALEEQQAKEDLFFGQAAIIWARWFLILAGGILVLWTAEDIDKLTLGIVPIALLMAMNFYLHARYLMERPVSGQMVLLTSLMDVVIIGLLVLFGPSDSRYIPGTEINMGPLFSQFYVFYYPMVLAFALVMPRKVEVGYTVLVCVTYGFIALLSIMSSDRPDVTTAVEIQEEFKLLAIRIITLAAMGGLGNYYFRIVRRRRAHRTLAGAGA
jgi:hypothetical protein